MMKKPNGFTLVELLVVVAIIGLLATLSVLALGSARVRARDAKRLADIKTVQTALELYSNDRGGYPVGQAGAGVPQVELGSSDAAVLTSSGFERTPTPGATVYLAQVPGDPQRVASSFLYVARMPDYTTGCTAGPCDNFTVLFWLEGGAQSLPAGWACYSSKFGLHTGGC